MKNLNFMKMGTINHIEDFQGLKTG